jgi:hypothetical protein
MTYCTIQEILRKPLKLQSERSLTDIILNTKAYKDEQIDVVDRLSVPIFTSSLLNYGERNFRIFSLSKNVYFDFALQITLVAYLHYEECQTFGPLAYGIQIFHICLMCTVLCVALQCNHRTNPTENLKCSS